MFTVVPCPSCRRKLKVSAASGGKKIQCPSCETTFTCRAEEAPAPGQPSPFSVLSPDAAPPAQEVPEPVSSPVAPGAATKEPLPEMSVSRSEPPLPAGSPRPVQTSIRKKSSAGLVIGLAAGGVTLLALVCAGAVGVILWSLNRDRDIPDSEWQTFSPPDGSFTVRMPGVPALAPVDGKGLEVKKYLLQHKASDSFFAVGHVDLPGDPPPGLLTQALAAERNNLIARVGGTVISERDVPFGPYPGRELQLKPDKGTGTLIEVVFLVKHGNTARLYVLGTGGPRIRPGTGDASKFFTSFAVREPSAPDPGGPPGPGGNPPPSPLLGPGGPEEVNNLKAHTERTTRFLFPPPGGTLVTAGDDGVSTRALVGVMVPPGFFVPTVRSRFLRPSG